jgi:hypothetical protein
MFFDIIPKKDREGNDTCHQETKIEVLHGRDKGKGGLNNGEGDAPDKDVGEES